MVDGAVTRRCRMPIDDSRRPELRTSRTLIEPMIQKKTAKMKKDQICAVKRVPNTPP